MSTRSVHIGMLLVMGAMGASGAAQTNDKPPDPKAASGAVTLTGCVEKGTAPNEFTIDDGGVGKYRVSGSRINRFVGQRVEVVGNLDNNRLRVRGGLYPSPNAAGQAGAMDPVKAAMAGQPGGPSAGTGGVQLPELKVKSVKTLGGGCG